MIIEKSNINKIRNKKDFFIHEDNNFYKKEGENDSISYISNNCQNIIDNNFCNFLSEECYKEINNKYLKNDIFNFTSFINSCKTYNNITELKNDFNKIIKGNNQEIEYYYNIIYNYLSSISLLISQKQFLEKENNYRELFEILKIFDQNFIISNNKSNAIKQEIINILKSIYRTLLKSINYKEKFNCIEIINNKIKIIENNINNINLNDNKIENISKNKNWNKNESVNETNLNKKSDFEKNEIIIHFDSYKKNNNFDYNDKQINNLDNDNNISKLNEAQFIDDNSFDEKSFQKDTNILNDKNDNLKNNKKAIKKKKHKKKEKIKEENKYCIKKKEEQTSYNYENIMCPPIKRDDESD